MNVVETIKIMAVLGSFIVMLSGFLMVYLTLKARQKSFGPVSSRTVGVILFIPSLIILAVTADLDAQLLAGLLGTVAGYTLSRDDKDP